MPPTGYYVKSLDAILSAREVSMQGIRLGVIAAVVSLLAPGCWLSDTDHPNPPDGFDDWWIVAEMTLDGDPLPADGHSMAEVAIRVFDKTADTRTPRVGMEVVVLSSRNQTDTIDFFEQPPGPTDADGRAVAFIGSSTPGQATISATGNDIALCKTWDGNECTQPLRQTMTFNP
jgi:hypothetical protein